MSKKISETYGNKESIKLLRPEIENFVKTVGENFCEMHGGRDVGKTYSVQKIIFADCIARHRETLVIFPTDKILKQGALKSWVSKVLKNEFRGYNFKYTDTECWWRQGKEGDWTRLCWAMPIRDAANGKLLNSPDTDYIIWDEALIETSLELKEKLIGMLMTVYETIDRQEDRVKVFIMGNPELPDDPFFEFFGWKGSELTKDHEGEVRRGINKVSWYVPKPPDTDQVNGVDTKFSQMINGTKYGRISKGDFELAVGSLVGLPADEAVIMSSYTVELKYHKYMGLFVCDDGIMYAEDIDEAELPFYERHFTLLLSSVTKEVSMLPDNFENILTLRIKKGKFKFCDVDCYVNLAASLKEAFRWGL